MSAATGEPVDLDAIRARCEAATPGPWKTDLFYVVAEVPGGRPGGEVIIQVQPTAGSLYRSRSDPSVKDAAFIAHARTDVPALLAEVERLRAALAEAQQMLREAYPHMERIFDDVCGSMCCDPDEGGCWLLRAEAAGYDRPCGGEREAE